MIDFETWEENLKVLQDCDADEMRLNTLVAIELKVCTDEFCESCDTVYADFGRPMGPQGTSADERATTPQLEAVDE